MELILTIRYWYTGGINHEIGWKFFDLKEYLEKELERKVDLVIEFSIRKPWKTSIIVLRGGK